MTVRELLARVDSHELSEWLAYASIRPFQDGFWQAGLICSTMSSLWSDKGHPLEDFLPAQARTYEGAEVERATPAEVASAFATLEANARALLKGQ